MDAKRPAPTRGESQWLQAKQNSQQELAEVIFASLVGQLPAIEAQGGLRGSSRSSGTAN